MSDIVLQGRGICTSFGSKRERRQVLFDVDVDVYEGAVSYTHLTLPTNSLV